MSFQVEISSVAKAEADAAFLRIAQLTSVEQGQEWYSDLIRAINSGSTELAMLISASNPCWARV